ncbi:MAG: PAS domain S-box protein [Candidatus Hermodarchaeota archaeon]|nr:PAS domain S-box protein [Candidatus Hermodarchaeota archaeon]
MSSHEQDSPENDEQEEESRFRLFFENAPLYCYMVSPQGIILDINKSALKALGYKRVELIGKHIRTIYTPEYEERVKQLIQEWKENGTLIDEELVIQSKNGEQRTILLNASAVRDLDDKLLYSISIQQDITERKETERALQESEERYRRLYDNLSDGFFITDMQGNISMCNNQGAKMFGYTPAELLGQQFTMLIHPYIRDTVTTLWQSAIESGQTDPLGIEGKGIRKDGTSFFYHATTSIITENGEPLHLQSLIRDITEVKETKTAYQSAVEQSLQGLTIIKDDEIVFANQAYADMLDLPLEELLELKFSDFIEMVYIDDRKALQEQYQARLAGDHDSSPFEFRIVRKDETTRWLEALSTKFELHGEQAIQYAILDVTERKNAEEAYRRLVDHSMMGLFIIQDGIVKFTNPAFLEISGYSEEDLLTFQPWQIFEIIHPDYRTIPWEMLRDSVDGKPGPSSVELKGIRKDGSIRWFDMSISVIEYQGKLASQVTIVDIDDRKIAQDAIRKERDRAQQYLDMAGVLFIAVNTEGNITLVNRKACEVLGYSEKELMGKNYFDTCIPERLRQEMKDTFRSNIVGETEPKGFTENPIITKDGAERIVAWHTTKLHDDDGTVIGALTAGEDISERKVAEVALRRERDRAQQYLDVAGAAFIGIDSQQRIFLVNRKGCDIIGYSEDELIGQNYFEMCIPERLRDDMKKFFEEAMTGKRQLSEYVENPVLTKEGKERIISWHTTVLHDDIGNITGILSSGEDITEQKIAELAMQASEEKFRTLVEDTADWVWEVDQQGQFIYSNNSVEEILGYTAGQIMGRIIWDYLDPDEVIETKEFFLENIEKRRPFKGLVNNYVYRDGNTVILEASARPIINEEGQVVGFRGVCRDITQRMLADQILRQSEARYRALVDTSPDAIFLTDIEGKILLANKQALKMLGYESEGELREKIAFDLVHPEARQQAIEELQRIVEARITGTRELPLMRKDGSIFPAGISASVLLDEESRPTGIIAIARDITKRKEEEQELSEAKSRAEFFTDLMAHDLNNINQAILTALELLHLDESISESVRKQTEVALEQVERSAALIGRVKKFSRLDATQPLFEVHDIEPDFQVALQSVRLEFSDKAIRVNTNIHPGTFKVLADDLLTDLFYNLLHNAVKFNRQDKIDIEAKVSPDFNKRFLRVEIIDNGPGIPDDLKELIFARYTNRVGEQVQGSGIGLTLVQQIVTRYGGKIWVEDRVEGDYSKGAKFVFLIPVWE